MSTTTEWVGQASRGAIPEGSETTSRSRAAVRPAQLLAGAAWLAQAVVLGFLACYLLGDATAGLLEVIGTGASATWQIGLAVIGLAAPFLTAAGIGVIIRREGASLPLTAAAMAATVLAAGLAELGLTALAVLVAGE